jgi:hypothetical protein
VPEHALVERNAEPRRLGDAQPALLRQQLTARQRCPDLVPPSRVLEQAGVSHAAASCREAAVFRMWE